VGSLGRQVGKIPMRTYIWNWRGNGNKNECDWQCVRAVIIGQGYVALAGWMTKIGEWNASRDVVFQTADGQKHNSMKHHGTQFRIRGGRRKERPPQIELDAVLVPLLRQQANKSPNADSACLPAYPAVQPTVPCGRDMASNAPSPASQPASQLASAASAQGGCFFFAHVQ